MLLYASSGAISSLAVLQDCVGHEPSEQLCSTMVRRLQLLAIELPVVTRRTVYEEVKKVFSVISSPSDSVAGPWFFFLARKYKTGFRMWYHLMDGGMSICHFLCGGLIALPGTRSVRDILFCPDGKTRRDGTGKVKIRIAHSQHLCICCRS